MNFEITVNGVCVKPVSKIIRVTALPFICNTWFKQYFTRSAIYAQYKNNTVMRRLV